MPTVLLSWQKEIPAVTGGVGTCHATNMSGALPIMHLWHAWVASLLIVRLHMMPYTPYLLHRLDTLAGARIKHVGGSSSKKSGKGAGNNKRQKGEEDD